MNLTVNDFLYAASAVVLLAVSIPYLVWMRRNT